jgi:LysR family nitrogen assimilation transcriptional regulator
MPASLRDIRLFVAAYEERSFTLAAQRGNATQSGVSQHIRNLEDAFNVQLFTRDRGRIGPTPAGDAYYRRCIDVLRAHDAATGALQGFARGLAGQIVVGLMPTMTRCIVAPVLARFLDLHPNVDVRIVEGYSGTLTQAVRAGDLDFAIVPSFAGHSGLRSKLFLRTPELLVAGPGAQRAPGAPVRLASLPPLRLVLPGRANTRRQTLETYCAMVGVEIERVLEMDTMFATLDFVARSDWVTILPAIMIGPELGPAYVANPIVDPPLMLELVLIELARRPLGRAAEVLLKLLATEARALVLFWESRMRKHDPDSANR